MEEKTKNRLGFLINLLYIVVIIVLIFLFFKYAFAWCSPFLVGLLVALSVEPLVRILSDKFALPRKIWSVVLPLLVWAILVFAVIKLGGVLYEQAKNMLAHIESLSLTDIINSIADTIVGITDGFAPHLSDSIRSLVGRFAEVIVNFTSGLLGGLMNFILSVPSIVMFFVVSIVSSVLISVDFFKIKDFFFYQIPAKHKVDLIEARDFLVNKIFRIVKAYSIIIVVTAIQLTIGFIILDIKFAVLVAIFVSLLDALPLIGTATFLVPWGIISLVEGDIRVGIGLLLLTAITAIVREIITPRIVSAHIGLTPLLTLLSMYVGLKIFGFAGMFVLPLAFMFIKDMNDTGRMQLWKNDSVVRVRKKKGSKP